MAAELLLAGVSAALQAVDMWLSVRDRRRAAEAFERTFEERARDPELLGLARYLEAAIPSDVLETMKDRVERCWEMYHDVLSDDDGYLPQEIDNATDAVQKCICRELRRIHKLSGAIPEGDMTDWWRKYCA